jgi:hypothetical protein
MRNFLGILIGLLITSCHSFFTFTTETKENDLYREYAMKVRKDTLMFNAYFDYYHDTINLDQVYLTKKDVRKIKKAAVPYQNGKQILFLHDEDDYYLNVIGYYYDDLFLKEVKPPRKIDFENIELTQGLGYHYMYNEMPISEFSIPYNSGLMRFIAVGNSEGYKIGPERFYKEIDFVFFVVNSKFFRLKP